MGYSSGPEALSKTQMQAIQIRNVQLLYKTDLRHRPNNKRCNSLLLGTDADLHCDTRFGRICHPDVSNNLAPCDRLSEQLESMADLVHRNIGAIEWL